jgi:hypothetical protein
MTVMSEPGEGIDLSDAVFEPNDDAPKRTRKPRSDKGQPRGTRGARSSGATAADRKLADDLLNPWGKAIKGVSFVMPTVGAVMAAKGELATAGIVAVSSPKMKAALAKAAKVGPGADLVEILVMMVVAGMVDMGQIAPDSFIPEAMGVKEYFDATHDKVDVPVDIPVNAGMPGFVPFPGA